MARMTRKGIENLINTPDVIEKAEMNWRDAQANRNKFAKWLDRFIKFALPVVAIVFYLQSAPHTAGMANRLTTGFGLTAPIGFEFMIFLLSVAMSRGLKKEGLKLFYWVAVVLTATLTIGGGVFSILESSGNEMVSMSINDIFDAFVTLPFLNQFLLVFVIPYGIFVTLSAKIIAELGISIVTGGLNLNKAENDIELKWLEVRFEEYKNALYLAATKAGVAQKTALKWATEKAQSLTENVNINSSIPSIPSVETMELQSDKLEMGFSAHAERRMNPSFPSIPSDGNSGNDGKIFQKPIDVALDHYRNNPQDMKLDPIELGKQIGVGKSTMYKARKQVYSEVNHEAK